MMNPKMTPTCFDPNAAPVIRRRLPLVGDHENRVNVHPCAGAS